ncbi:hypothetical protein [Leptothoe sp. PORK10 BA2]|uniref:hypothetical protein n=1 Tax=Leptothoe sp. PORK10 BA2 TaxID=3110254 RepID=UPI002B1FB950|nr:hypothetical protein [Leptothoe sp. PORK10 BA2]MEA5464508.1 hypothetical protein [Leptothoe sp. PORK10 BA2]
MPITGRLGQLWWWEFCWVEVGLRTTAASKKPQQRQGQVSTIYQVRTLGMGMQLRRLPRVEVAIAKVSADVIATLKRLHPKEKAAIGVPKTA